MSLTKEQIAEIKRQLYAQIQNLPEDKKKQAIQQIENLTEEQMESLLEEQKGKANQEVNNKGIFRRIIDKEIPSKIVDENKEIIAALDIRPISKGHLVIIPKRAVSDVRQFPSSGFSVAKRLAKRIESKLGSKGAEIQTEFKFGEIILNLIPIYDKSLNINSPRTEPNEKELESIYQILRIVKKPKTTKPKILVKSPEKNTLKINRRIP